MLAKLKANRTLILSLFLANVHFLDNKVDVILLSLKVSQKMRSCAVLCLVEA